MTGCLPFFVVPGWAVSDLLAGALLILAVSAGLFGLGFRVGRRRSKRLALAAAAATVGFLLWFALVVHGTLRVAQILPLSNAIMLGNWIPPGAGFLAGIVAGRSGIPWWRRSAFALILLSLAGYSVLCHFVGKCPPAPHCWVVADVTVQSRAATCGPCCAATLLRHHGIHATEREMIDLCLTTARGTPSLGLYRGLKIKTAGTEWDVQVVRGSMQQLCDANRWPVLLRVRLDAPRVVAGRPRSYYPAPGRLTHTVVMFGRTERGLAEVGDPALDSRARRHQRLDELAASWTGEGLRLVKRDR